MSFKPYIDLHVHSHYSLLDGVSSPEEIIERAKELGATSVAITDHGNVSGIYEFYWAAKKVGIKPLIGCEFYMKGDLSNNDSKYFHGILIAMNKKGFENLLKLSSMARNEEHMIGTTERNKRPIISFKEIFKHSEGLLFSTACVVGISGACQKKMAKLKTGKGNKYESHNLSFQEVDLLFGAFKAVFKDRMFVEIHPARVNTDYNNNVFVVRPVENTEFGELQFSTNCLQEEHNRRSILMAKRHGLPLVIATDAHMIRPDLKTVQDLLIKNAADNFNGWHFDETFSMVGSEEMWNMFQKNHPYITKELFEQCIDNTYMAASLCEDIQLDFKTIVPKFPLWLLEKKIADSAVQAYFHERYKDIYKPGMTSREMMFAIIKRTGRMPKDNLQYLRRLQEEVKVICDNGIIDFTDYFLILSDTVNAAPYLGVGVGPGRGSSAGCLLAYLLGVTSIDPIKYDLSFVRFLNAGRIESGQMPDIDLDFSNRSLIVKYLFELYGKDYVSLVGTFQTIKTKNALKDIVRTLNGGHLKSDDEIFKVCAEIDTAPQYYPTEKAFLEGFTDDDGDYHSGMLESNKTLRTYLETHPEVNKMLFEILEKPRNQSKHAGGVVITSPISIDSVIPTQFLHGDKSTQVDYRTLEKIGGLKIDILGVNTLNFIWDAVKLIEKRHGIKLDPWNLPEDIQVFKMLSRGDTSTVFQLDTQVAIPILKAISVNSISDLALVTAVGRPGCLDSKLEDGVSVADHFIKRKRGEEPLVLLDPILEPILGKTYSIPIFQEQVQKIFEVVGGLSPVESDDARRAMGKKNLQVLLSIKKQLFDGAQFRLGWNEEKCEALWQSFIGSANYNFNEAHAYGYSVIAYACAYLKKKYPLEWWCAVLSHIGSDKVKTYLGEIEDFMKLPNVNYPQNQWVITEDSKLISPLTLILGISEKTVGEIALNSPFTSFEDFFNRVHKRTVNKTAINNMIITGCFTRIPIRDGGPLLTDSQNDTNALLAHFGELRREKEPPRTWTDLELIKERSRLLSVVSYEYVEIFKESLKNSKNLDFIEVRNEVGDIFYKIDNCIVITNSDNFDFWYQNLGLDTKICFVGIFNDESKMFHYIEKKTGNKVGAYKLLVENDNRIVETVIWPNTLSKTSKRDFENGAILAVFGTLRKSGFKKNIEFSYLFHKRIL